jgi:hypothetical protein
MRLSTVTKAKTSLSVDISCGKGGQRTSKRGCVSIEFALQNGEIPVRIVNMNIDHSSKEGRMRDLAQIMLAHYDFLKQTTQGGASTLFMCGGFNFEVRLLQSHKSRIQNSLKEKDWNEIEECL